MRSIQTALVGLSLACAVGVAGCSDLGGSGGQDPSAAPTLAATSPPPGSSLPPDDGVERSITGLAVKLPPPPAGGFDPAVVVRFENAPPIRAEVARRPDQRSRGLMQRRTLPAGTGMVFLFPRQSTGGFYMLGTLLPLSIAYVDGDRVVSTAEMLPCPDEQCPTYPPTGPYTLVVEAPAGFFPAHGVRADTRVTLQGATTPPS